ncbi:MAG: 1,4-alpha-glucan branching protein GlgB [Polyangiaceae bacterium]
MRASNQIDPEMTGDADARARLSRGELHDPHGLLGAHPFHGGATRGVVVRAFHPDATDAWCLVDDQAHAMHAAGKGLFVAFFEGASMPLAHQVRFRFTDGLEWTCKDRYRHAPSLGETDLHLFNEGNHRKLWSVMGANVRCMDGDWGTAFAVWAPNAKAVSVVGDFNAWNGRLHPMRSLGASGVWELFIPDVGEGAHYKFEIRTRAGGVIQKADPYAKQAELPPKTASVVSASKHEWGDSGWMTRRKSVDPRTEPMSVYEVHLGSWRRVPEDGNRSLSYREIAAPLIEHVKSLGCTHVELMPIAEHPFFGSWGYQVTGYFAPTARYGGADDFRYFVDALHQAGIGVILDWVPAHFPKDDFALARFDGTCLYEHEDSRRGEHPDWGTLIFNYGRSEVRAFLLANALYWLKEFHVDALRVDAVASMLYLDYSREEGQWLPNAYGGRENIEAIDLIKAVNHIIGEEEPGAFSIAEESTAWGGVTRAAVDGGLGFTFKWNMGWMHDTLKYFEKEPVHRKFHQDQLTFSMIYEYHECFVNSLSHDEVVHGKGSLFSKMPGDPWQKLANLRALAAYQYTRPGKQLIFMGQEIAQTTEWNHDGSVDWHLLAQPEHRQFFEFMKALGTTYLHTPALFQADPKPESFQWIDAGDHQNSVMSYLRLADDQVAAVILNLTPVPRDGYRIGAPRGGKWRVAINTDDVQWGGGGYFKPKEVEADRAEQHGREHSWLLALPPLSVLVLVPA